MYMEYISNIPPTVRIFIEGPDESYTLHGFHKLAVSSNLMVSELNIENKSEFKLVLKDSDIDDIYEWNMPDMYKIILKIYGWCWI